MDPQGFPIALMRRRLSVLGLVALCAACYISPRAVTPRHLAGASNVYDIVVVGAGPGGVAAAIQAARLTTRVLLVEETDQVGGQLIVVGNMDGGHRPETNTGLYREFVRAMHEYYGGRSTATCYWSDSSECYEPHAVRTILRAMLQREGVVLRQQRRVVGLSKTGNAITGVVLSDGEHVASKIVVDSTEYGDIIPLAGARYRIGNSMNEATGATPCVDSITYAVTLKKYPGGVPRKLQMTIPPPRYGDYRDHFRHTVALSGAGRWTGTYPVSFAVHNQYRGLPDSTNPLSYSSSRGEITKTNVNWANDYPTQMSEQSAKRVVLHADYVESRTERRRYNCEAKLETLNFIYYVQHDLNETQWSVANDEGFDTPYNESQLCQNIPSEFKAIERQFPPFPYVREARRIVPSRVLMAADIRRVNGIQIRGSSESIAVGDYATDKHNCNSDKDLENALGETASDASGDGPFEVPMSALIPERVDGFLVAEKNVGATRLAEGALRLQPVSMAIGQAVGAIAAIAVRHNKPPRTVDVLEVQRVLTGAGASISKYAYVDVPSGHPRWKDVQLVSSHQIMAGYGNGQFGANDPVTRSEAAAVIDATGNWRRDEAGFEGTAGGSNARELPRPPSKDGPRTALDKGITRAELAELIVRSRARDPQATATDSRVDPPESDRSRRYLQIAVSEGYLPACAVGQSCDDASVTRGEMAAVAALLLH